MRTRPQIGVLIDGLGHNGGRSELTLFWMGGGGQCPPDRYFEKKSDPLRAEGPKGSDFYFILVSHVLAKEGVV